MISRSALIDRVLQDLPCTVASTSKSNPTWTDIYQFEEDNLHEVDVKIENIDNQIWAKLIVMEKGTRTVKAYLRSQRVIIDGSTYDYDGIRMGIQRFRNPQRNASNELATDLLGKGIELTFDDNGNIWLHNNTEKSLSILSQGIKYETSNMVEKIFDLNAFKNIFLQSNGTNGRRDAIIYIQFSPCGNILSSPLLLCLINITAIQMTSLLSTRAVCTLAHLSNNDSTNSIFPFYQEGSEPIFLPTTSHKYRKANVDNQKMHPLLDIVKPLSKDTTLQSNSSQLRSGINSLQISTDEEYSVPQITVSPVTQRQLMEDSIIEINPTHYTPNNSGSCSTTIISAMDYLSSIDSGHSHQKWTIERTGFLSSRGENREELKKSTRKDCNAPTMLVSENLKRMTSNISTTQDIASLINLRTLFNLRRPAYFSHAISKRGGSGHVLRKSTSDT